MFKTTAMLLAGLAVCLLTTVCYAQDTDVLASLQGNWKCNAEKTIVLMKEAGVPDEQIEMAKGMLDGVKMEFTSENLVLSMMGQDVKATYNVEDSSEEKKWVKLKVEVPQRPDAKSFEITLDDADSFTVKLDERTMVFDRIKNDKSDG